MQSTMPNGSEEQTDDIFRKSSECLPSCFTKIIEVEKNLARFQAPHDRPRRHILQSIKGYLRVDKLAVSVDFSLHS